MKDLQAAKMEGRIIQAAEAWYEARQRWLEADDDSCWIEQRRAEYRSLTDTLARELGLLRLHREQTARRIAEEGPQGNG